MNNLNHASFKASKKLHDAGIILETDFIYNSDGKLLYSPLVERRDGDIPAPSMIEVWRELPDGTELSKNGLVYASIESDEGFYKEFVSDNPTDALIDLLIWVKEQNRERIVKKLIDHADKLKW